MEITKDFQEYRQFAFHVAAARPVDSAVADRRTVLRSLGPRNYIEMSKKHNLRDKNIVRQDYSRRTPLFPKPVNLHCAGQFHVVDYEFHAAFDILGTIARARNDDQIASELNQSPAQGFV